MLAIATLLIIVTVSLLVTRVATVALELTGMSESAAKFQARSAFTGVGFTTGEAEQIVNHPVRRRIVMLLMLIGNVGLVTILSSVVLSFINIGTDTGETWQRWVFLFAGLALLWGLASSKWVERRLERLISWALHRFTDLDVRDYANLLHLSAGYGITEVTMHDPELDGRSLADTGFQRAGILVLGIRQPDGTYSGAPHGGSEVHIGDTLFLYGSTRSVNEFCAARNAELEGAFRV